MPYGLITLLTLIFLLFSPLGSRYSVAAETTAQAGDVHRGFWVWAIPDPYTFLHRDFWRWSTAAASEQLRSEFWTWYLQVMPPKNIRIQATRRGIGESVYVFVRDEDWQNTVTKEDVDKIIDAFEHFTPANPNKGIYQIATDAFGLPPDKDGDPRIYILISELGEFHGHHFDGFFRYVDQTDDEHSNKLDIIYVDAHNPSDDYHLGVLSHEFQHLIHWRYDQKEENWVNETLSEVCMILCGYYTDKKHVMDYLKNPDRALVTKVHGGVSYGACLLWGTYIYDRLGKGFLGTWVTEKSQGIKGFNAALRAFGQKDKFMDYFGDWMVALYLNDPSISGGRYYLRSVRPETTPSAEVVTSYPLNIDRSVNGFGIDYLKFGLRQAGIGKLRITLSGEDSQLLVKVIKINKDKPSLTEVDEIQSKEVNLKIDNAKDLYNEVVLAITVPEVTDKPVKYHLRALDISSENVVETAISAGD